MNIKDKENDTGEVNGNIKANVNVKEKKKRKEKII